MLSQWFLVGAGRCGIQLARAMAAAGLDIVGVESRSPASRARARRALPGVPAAAPGGRPPEGAGLLIAVPDSAVAACAASLAARLCGPTPLALHTSGFLASGALAPLARRGCPTGSLHPLVSFPSATGAAVPLAGVTAAVEGREAAVREARDLARALGMKPVRICAHAKARYHAAAALAANMSHILVATAKEQLVRAGLSRRAAADALAPLAAGAIGAALTARGLENLTGPVARGDAATVRAHLAALPKEIATAYRALAHHALERLVAQGLMGRAQARKVASALTSLG